MSTKLSQVKVKQVFDECTKALVKIQKIEDILSKAQSDVLRDVYAESYLDKIEEVIYWDHI